ncbi:MAG: hypothetical protein V4492_07555 [Chlamydiota bacterium]
MPKVTHVPSRYEMKIAESQNPSSRSMFRREFTAIDRVHLQRGLIAETVQTARAALDELGQISRPDTEKRLAKLYLDMRFSPAEKRLMQRGGEMVQCSGQGTRTVTAEKLRTKYERQKVLAMESSRSTLRILNEVNKFYLNEISERAGELGKMFRRLKESPRDGRARELRKALTDDYSPADLSAPELRKILAFRDTILPLSQDAVQKWRGVKQSIESCENDVNDGRTFSVQPISMSIVHTAVTLQKWHYLRQHIDQ